MNLARVISEYDTLILGIIINNHTNIFYLILIKFEIQLRPFFVLRSNTTKFCFLKRKKTAKF